MSKTNNEGEPVLTGAVRASKIEKRHLLLFDRLAAVSYEHSIEMGPPALRADLEFLLDSGAVDAFGAWSDREVAVVLERPEMYWMGVIAHLGNVAYRLGGRVARMLDQAPTDTDALEALTRFALQNRYAYEVRLAAVFEALEGQPCLPIIPHLPRMDEWDLPSNLEAVLLTVGTLGDELLELVESAKAKEDEQFLRSTAVVVNAVLPADAREQPGPPERAEVATIMLRAFPAPGPLTPWEAVVDFSRSEEVRGYRLALRRWMRSVVRQQFSALELAQEIEELLWEYQTFMRQKRVEIEYSPLETLLTVPADVLEGTVRLRFGAAARSLFSFRRRRAALMAAEREAPGREVALLQVSEEQFAGDSHNQAAP